MMNLNMKTKLIGRPRKEEKKTEGVYMRFTVKEYAKLRRIAGKDGVGAYCRSLVMEELKLQEKI